MPCRRAQPSSTADGTTPGQFLDAVYEIHGASVLALRAASADIHVQTGMAAMTNFDVRVCLVGHAVNADCKTRHDVFPFNVPRRDEGPDGVKGFFGVRAALDPHDSEALGIPVTPPPGEAHWVPTPEGTVIRQLLSAALNQLPNTGINLILVAFCGFDSRPWAVHFTALTSSTGIPMTTLQCQLRFVIDSLKPFRPLLRQTRRPVQIRKLVPTPVGTSPLLNRPLRPHLPPGRSSRGPSLNEGVSWRQLK